MLVFSVLGVCVCVCVCVCVVLIFLSSDMVSSLFQELCD